MNLKSSPSSSSRDYKSTSSPTSASHESHLSLSTITLNTSTIDPSYLNKPITRFPQSKDEEAATYTQSPSQDTAPAYDTPYSSSYPEVYLVSPEHPATDDADTFTISTFSYYGGAPSPSSSHRFELTRPSSASEPQALSPPPVCPIVKRPVPRDVPSSADSVMTDFPSRPSSPALVPTLPQDVTESLPGTRTMNIPGGILVTVQKQASVDRMV